MDTRVADTAMLIGRVHAYAERIESTLDRRVAQVGRELLRLPTRRALDKVRAAISDLGERMLYSGASLHKRLDDHEHRVDNLMLALGLALPKPDLAGPSKTN